MIFFYHFFVRKNLSVTAASFVTVGPIGRRREKKKTPRETSRKSTGWRTTATMTKRSPCTLLCIRAAVLRGTRPPRPPPRPWLFRAATPPNVPLPPFPGPLLLFLRILICRTPLHPLASRVSRSHASAGLSNDSTKLQQFFLSPQSFSERHETTREGGRPQNGAHLNRGASVVGGRICKALVFVFMYFFPLVFPPPFLVNDLRIDYAEIIIQPWRICAEKILKFDEF